MESGRDTSHADDLAFAGRKIVEQILVVPLAIGRRHQNFHVLADYIVLGITEHPLCSGAERKNGALFVDDDHRIRHRCENRPKMGFGLGARFGGRLVHEAARG